MSTQTKHSSSDSDRRDSNEKADGENYTKKYILQTFDGESFTRLQQVLEFIDEKAYNQLYLKYNTRLCQGIELCVEHLPPDFTEDSYITLRAKCHSFYFIRDVGNIVIEKINSGDVKAEQYFVKLIKVVLHHCLTGGGYTPNLALVELEHLCKNRKISRQTLYSNHRTKFLRVIIKAVLQKLKNNMKENSTSGSSEESINGWTDGRNLVIKYMTSLALELFNVAAMTTEDVAQSLIIIINLIHKDIHNESVKSFLEYIASHQGIDLYTLLKNHIQTILVSLILRRKLSHFDLTNCIDKLLSFCKNETGGLVYGQLTFIKARLLLHYSTDAKSVSDGIYFLSKYEILDDQPFEDQLDDEEYFIEYLDPAMVGILLGIDNHFISTSKQFGSVESINQIKSLGKLLDLLDDKKVQVIHVKLLSTLSLLIRLRRDHSNHVLNAAILDLWSKFTSKLSRDLKSELIINICVTLHDMIFDEPDKVAFIYKDLIANEVGFNRGKNLRFLFFIPDIEGCTAMKSIYNLLSRSIKRDTLVSSLSQLQQALNSVIPLLKFENHKCHLLAIRKIRDLLRVNQRMLIDIMLSNTEEPLDKVISSTIESLLALSSLQDHEGSPLIAECLGIIGALNPTRLDHLIYGDIHDESLSKLSFKSPSLTEPSFIVELIEKLANSLFSDQKDESETANYALQVVSVNYLKTENSPIREKLSIAGRRACQICQSTDYRGLKKAQPDLTTSVFEKFKTEGHYSYRDWLDRFSLNLASIIADNSIRDVLFACSYVFKFNVKLAEYLIPHAMVHIIVNNQRDDVDLLNREIMAILNEDIGVSTQDLDTVYKDETKGSIQTLHFQCSNMVFFALDVIYRLECSARCVKNQANNKQVLSNLVQFLDSIPKDRLGILATKCRSPARALCYFDQYLFQNKNQFNKYATTLQKIFFALDDSYEAAGIQMVRTTPTSISDDIANYESSGRFDKAFICCSTALEFSQVDSDRSPLIEDALRCLSHQGDYMRLYEKSYQFSTEFSQYKRTTLPYAIEATWKLGRWEDLDNIFSHENTDNLLEAAPVSQGFLLRSALEEQENVPQKLKIVRHRLMKPLSIAMMDRSGYFRGYHSLLNLHSIEDFNQILQFLNQNLDLPNQIQTGKFESDENSIDEYLVSLNASFDRLFELWDKRNKLVQPSPRNLDLLQSWQRAIIQVLGKKCPMLENRLSVDIGRSWINSADSAREGKYFDRSFFCLTQARRWFGSEFEHLDLKTKAKYHIGQAKLDWDQGEQTKAIRGLKLTYERLKDHPLYKHLEARLKRPSPDPFPELNNLRPCNQCTSYDQSERESFAEIKMLLTQYCEDAAAGIPATLFFMYEECVHLGVFQEDIYFRLARYYDKLLAYYVDNPNLCGVQPVEEKILVDSTQKYSQNFVSGDKDEVYTKLMEHSVIAFGNSLKYGVKHIRESMPRMLNIWYDLGSKKTKQGARSISHRVEVTVRFIDDLRKTLPTYYFLVASSILLSRVCHPHSGVSKKTCEIIEVLLTKYPLQVTWLMLALINDSKGENEDRKKAANRIVQKCRSKNEAVDAILATTNFSSEIMAIAMNKRDKMTGKNIKRYGPKVDLSEISSTAARFDFTKQKVIAPVQSTIRAIIPAAMSKQDQDRGLTYPSQDFLFVESFHPEVRNFNSLQQPRAVTLRCSDGKSVSLLCKVGDDLRKDSRCVEFLNLLNSILRRDSQSHARFMEIQTFLVLPLDNCVGIIEMVPDLETLRNLIDPLYKEKRSNFSMHDQLPKGKREWSPEEAKNLFVSHVLPKVSPPVLPTWFLRQFTEPTSWYMARLAFTRSTAVVSMGGYIIGLGDRHLDNILVNKRDGRVVHVDFNLLFHQGESLQVPELVPFRLTQNFVATFGPLGTEGNFRKVCEITMRVMRKEKDALLTTLKPFMHDPCSEWIKVRDKTTNRPDQEDKHCENTSAKFRIEVTERKLKGYPRSKSFKPLTLLDSYSVEAQVDNLIDEATDLANLALMYYGWCPHI